MNRLQTWLAAVLLCAWFALPAQEVLRIRKISIEFSGKDRVGITEEFVRSHIRLKVGDAYKVGDENEDVRNLVGTGKTEHVDVKSAKVDGGVELIYHVERPRNTGTVVLRGFDGQRFIPVQRLAFKETTLRPLLKTGQGAPFSQKNLDASVKALLQHYFDKGYHSVQVRPELLPKQNEEVDVVFTITEGEKVEIETLIFRKAVAVDAIDPVTDTFTTAHAHGLASGDTVRLFAQERGSGADAPLARVRVPQAAVAGGFVTNELNRAASYFVRVTANNQFTLHANATDARAAANRYDIISGDKPHHVVLPAAPALFTHKVLSKAIVTKERVRWYNPITWFSGDGRQIEDNFQEDIKLLKEKYHDEGHLDVVVDIAKSTDVDFNSDSVYATAHQDWRKAQAAEDILAGMIQQMPKDGVVELDGEPRTRAQMQALHATAKAQTKKANSRYKAIRGKADDAVLIYRVTEGQQYRVGKVSISYGNFGNDGFNVQPNHKPVIASEQLMARLRMKTGSVFRPKLLTRDDRKSDLEALQLVYGEKSYIKTNIRVHQEPDPASGLMDVAYQIEEGRPVFLELIKIEGNEKTKDFVIRRELAITPGEPFDMGRVKLSEDRLNNMRLFQRVRVDPQADPNLPVDRENLVITVKEKNTGNAGFGGGFSTDYGAFGQIFYSEENFDIARWHRPNILRGGGQKFRVRASLGDKRDDYGLDFEEPWMFGRKLRFRTNLFRRESTYYSDYYGVEETGINLSLERTLFGLDYLRAGIHYKAESSGIIDVISTASSEMKADAGRNFISQVGASLTYDTRGAGVLPNKGQQTELFAGLAGGPFGGEMDFYKLDLRSGHYFRGLREGHVIELIGRVAVVENYGDSTKVPYLDRFALGGGSSLRGFEFWQVGPRDANNQVIGGRSLLMATIEYSVPTPLDIVRVAYFYDIGAVSRDAYKVGKYNDDIGIGLRLDVPFLGPMRLDLARPITSDAYNDNGLNFSFSFGYTRSF